MTRAEFETWIEANYDDMARWARRCVEPAGDDDEAADVLHHAIASAFGLGGTRGPAPSLWYLTSTNPKARMMVAIRGIARDFRERRANASAAEGDLAYFNAPSHGRRVPPADASE